MASRVLPNSQNRITQAYSSSHLAVDLGWVTNESENIVKLIVQVL